MRRTVATLLVTALLSSSVPSAIRDRDGDWSPIQILKKIVRLLIPAPSDTGDNLSPPKP